MKRKFAQISAKKMTEEQIRNDLIAAVKGDASGLFTHDPVLNIKFSVSPCLREKLMWAEKSCLKA
ncbi:secreted protein [Neisseria gonorrhoeae]|uniref:Secreted protein n=1 Tax=Neisseria gonorrhoeae TaxID=485 RepID=A0A378VZN7_NEIGO|nr:secreted protein [Neisseria gonorrhoeae]